MASGHHVLGIVLAGGEGKRLMPLTADRAKPAVPFAGNFRLVDFVLSSLVNGGITRILVLTQYKSHSLDRHITKTWRLSQLTGDYITSVPAQQRLGPRWYAGSADAIYQNLNLVYDENPDYIAVFGADNVYRMNPELMLEQHISGGAGATVAGLRVPRHQATEFGVIQTDEDGQSVAAFLEKPEDPPGLPDSPEESYVSMGNYMFTADVLIDVLNADAEDASSKHDMGGNIIPTLTERGQTQVFDFTSSDVPGETNRDKGYWRDVGTLDAYYEAHMDLISALPVFNLYNTSWPLYSSPPSLPPAKFVAGGSATESMVCEGVVVGGGTVVHSVLGPGVRVEEGAFVADSVLLDNCVVGKGAVVRRAILDKNVVVQDGARLGVDPVSDRERYSVSDGGIVVLGKGQRAL
jgi:glucose-1-phosphate adenylyltransferase